VIRGHYDPFRFIYSIKRTRGFVILVLVYKRSGHGQEWTRQEGPPGTRSTDDSLNVRPNAATLEVRKNFFSSRVTENWNKIPSHVTNLKNSEWLQEKLQITESWLLLPRGNKIWRQDGGTEHITRGRHFPRFKLSCGSPYHESYCT